ncbi:hypothetical protein GQR58_006572 [Nymphon striatum]|nr:hypothetical protein GQR58_006572 [Nymphon striatum]
MALLLCSNRVKRFIAGYFTVLWVFVLKLRRTKIEMLFIQEKINIYEDSVQNVDEKRPKNIVAIFTKTYATSEFLFRFLSSLPHFIAKSTRVRHLFIGDELIIQVNCVQNISCKYLPNHIDLRIMASSQWMDLGVVGAICQYIDENVVSPGIY